MGRVPVPVCVSPAPVVVQVLQVVATVTVGMCHMCHMPATLGAAVGNAGKVVGVGVERGMAPV